MMKKNENRTVALLSLPNGRGWQYRFGSFRITHTDGRIEMYQFGDPGVDGWRRVCRYVPVGGTEYRVNEVDGACTCPGWRRWKKCKHNSALVALAKKGLLP
jgi:hypothetical protein